MNSQTLDYVHPKYRPDIDGLRALAVLSVVAYHAFPLKIQGGFIGVDIFFVISGFLISTIIFQNLECERFSFIEFYQRRMKRIFPALFCVLAFCFLFGWFGLYSEEYQQLGKHIVAGGGFYSNILLWHESGYFDNVAETKPLLHLWSLGIEEQFYIVCPLLLWFLWKRRLNPLIPILCLFIASFILNLIGIHKDSIGTFYSPQTRFWELLIGVMLAYQTRYGFNFKSQPCLKTNSLSHLTYAHHLSSFVGLSFILVGFVLVSKLRLFPGAWALLPTIGAALIINAGPLAWLNQHVLANKVLVWFGLISFPLYLWHWPILSFIHIINGPENSRVLRIVAVLGSIFCAWLTYRFIEKPIRYGKHHTIKPIAWAGVAVMLMGFSLYQNEGYPARTTLMAKQNSWTDKKQVLAGYERSEIYQQAPAIKERDFYLSNTRPGLKANIAILGDSHANRLYWALSSYKEMKLINLGRGTCPPLLDVEVLKPDGQSLGCQPLTNNYLKYIKEDPNIQVIVINAFYNQYQRDFVLNAKHKKISLAKALKHTLDYFHETHKKIIVALDVPEIPRSCYQRSFPVWKKNLNTRCTISRDEFVMQNQPILHALSAYKEIAVFNPESIFCQQQCGEIDARNYLYLRDGNHLNDFGLAKLSPVIHDLLLKKLS